ncbi:hypothetical protein [Methanoculleus sp.]|uniref:hypothetical protein n=1 Tax=Methanoculleus sp. TaxID=90427 RepID=UPI0025DA3042|nr:hypothetical protein [Methanoculleus sp.]
MLSVRRPRRITGGQQAKLPEDLREDDRRTIVEARRMRSFALPPSAKTAAKLRAVTFAVPVCGSAAGPPGNQQNQHN